MKYSDKLVEKIVRLIEEDSYTIAEICRALKINPKTFYEWKKIKPEFRNAIEDAENRRDETLATLARHSLREQIEGYIEVTEKIVYEDDGWGGLKMKSKIVTKKKRAPKAHVLKLALERHDRNKEKVKGEAENPANKPIIMKVPVNMDPAEAIRIVKDFKEKNQRGVTVSKQVQEEEDENYETVVI